MSYSGCSWAIRFFFVQLEKVRDFQRDATRKKLEEGGEWNEWKEGIEE